MYLELAIVGSRINWCLLSLPVALVNEYACKGLDQLEENLPFLQQPADKVRKGFSWGSHGLVGTEEYGEINKAQGKLERCPQH